MLNTLKKIRKAVIPAAGFGTRFLPITKVVPKELLPIGNKPAIQYVVEEAVAAGIEEIILVCHPSKTEIMDYFRPDKGLRSFLEKKGKKEEIEELERIESMVRFRVVYQDEPLGLGHAVLCAREAVGDESFLVMLPDVLIADGVPASRRLLAACGGEGSWGILLERVSREKASAYGIIRGGEVSPGLFRVEGAVEKPTGKDVPSDLAILGRYLFTPEIFEILGGLRSGAIGEIQLTDAIDQLAKIRRGAGLLCRGEIFDIGTPEGLLEACQSSEFGQQVRPYISSKRSMSSSPR